MDGNEGGLTCMRGDKFVTYTRADGLTNDNITCLFEDQMQNLWITTNGGGLSVWRNGKFTNFTTKDGLSTTSRRVSAGERWKPYIGTNNGLVKYVNGVFTTVHNSRRPYWQYCARGISRFRQCPVDWHHCDSADLRMGNGPTSRWRRIGGLSSKKLFRDRDGNLWIGTNGGGLSRMSGTQSLPIQPMMINWWYVSASLKTMKESLVGTVGGGLHLFCDGKFTVFGEKKVAQDNTRAVYEARDGSVWVVQIFMGWRALKRWIESVHTYPCYCHFGHEVFAKARMALYG